MFVVPVHSIYKALRPSFHMGDYFLSFRSQAKCPFSHKHVFTNQYKGVFSEILLYYFTSLIIFINIKLHLLLTINYRYGLNVFAPLNSYVEALILETIAFNMDISVYIYVNS